MARGGRWMLYIGTPITAGMSSGPTTPSWVPANAKIHIDFVGGSPQGRAWSDGAEVAINTLLGSDPNTENAWGESRYDPALLTADGYADPDEILGFIGALRTLLLAGATLRIALKETNQSNVTLALVSADGNEAVSIDINAGSSDLSVQGYTWSGPLSAADNQIPNILNTGAGALNAVATTVTATRLDLAANGSDALAAVLSETDRPPGNPMVAAFIDSKGESIQSITIYDPLPTTAGLSELSALT